MKANLIILLTLTKLLLIDPTTAAQFKPRDEWDCLSELLLNEQYMRILLSMDDSECRNGPLDFDSLFARVKTIAAQEQDYDINTQSSADLIRIAEGFKKQSNKLQETLQGMDKITKLVGTTKIKPMTNEAKTIDFNNQLQQIQMQYEQRTEDIRNQALIDDDLSFEDIVIDIKKQEFTPITVKPVGLQRKELRYDVKEIKIDNGLDKIKKTDPVPVTVNKVETKVEDKVTLDLENVSSFIKSKLNLNTVKPKPKRETHEERRERLRNGTINPRFEKMNQIEPESPKQKTIDLQTDLLNIQMSNINKTKKQEPAVEDDFDLDIVPITINTAQTGYNGIKLDKPKIGKKYVNITVDEKKPVIPVVNDKITEKQTTIEPVIPETINSQKTEIENKMNMFMKKNFVKQRQDRIKNNIKNGKIEPLVKKPFKKPDQVNVNIDDRLNQLLLNHQQKNIIKNTVIPDDDFYLGEITLDTHKDDYKPISIKKPVIQKKYIKTNVVEKPIQIKPKKQEDNNPIANELKPIPLIKPVETTVFTHEPLELFNENVVEDKEVFNTIEMVMAPKKVVKKEEKPLEIINQEFEDTPVFNTIEMVMAPKKVVTKIENPLEVINQEFEDKEVFNTIEMVIAPKRVIKKTDEPTIKPKVELTTGDNKVTNEPISKLKRLSAIEPEKGTITNNTIDLETQLNNLIVKKKDIINNKADSFDEDELNIDVTLDQKPNNVNPIHLDKPKIGKKYIVSNVVERDVNPAINKSTIEPTTPTNITAENEQNKVEIIPSIVKPKVVEINDPNAQTITQKVENDPFVMPVFEDTEQMVDIVMDEIKPRIPIKPIKKDEPTDVQINTINTTNDPISLIDSPNKKAEISIEERPTVTPRNNVINQSLVSDEEEEIIFSTPKKKKIISMSDEDNFENLLDTDRKRNVINPFNNESMVESLGETPRRIIPGYLNESHTDLKKDIIMNTPGRQRRNSLIENPESLLDSSRDSVISRKPNVEPLILNGSLTDSMIDGDIRINTPIKKKSVVDPLNRSIKSNESEIDNSSSIEDNNTIKKVVPIVRQISLTDREVDPVIQRPEKIDRRDSFINLEDSINQLSMTEKKKRSSSSSSSHKSSSSHSSHKSSSSNSSSDEELEPSKRTIKTSVHDNTIIPELSDIESPRHSTRKSIISDNSLIEDLIKTPIKRPSKINIQASLIENEIDPTLNSPETIKNQSQIDEYEEEVSNMDILHKTTSIRLDPSSIEESVVSERDLTPSELDNTISIINNELAVDFKRREKINKPIVNNSELDSEMGDTITDLNIPENKITTNPSDKPIKVSLIDPKNHIKKITLTNISINSSLVEDENTSEADMSIISDEPSIRNALNYITNVMKPIHITKFSEDDNRSLRGPSRTMFALQGRGLRSDTRSKEEIMAELMRLFKLLPVCIQNALLQCKAKMDNVKAECEKNYENNKDCFVDDFTAKIRCNEDEELIGDVCYKKCPNGFIDRANYCLKSNYLKRNVTEFVGQQINNETEEVWGNKYVVVKCSNFGKYYENVGLRLCRLRCPDGFKDRGMMCEKPYRFKGQKIFTYSASSM